MYYGMPRSKPNYYIVNLYKLVLIPQNFTSKKVMGNFHFQEAQAENIFLAIIEDSIRMLGDFEFVP